MGPKLFVYMEKLDKCGGQQLDSWSCGCPSNNMNLITHANRHTLKIFGEMPQQTLTEIGELLAQYEDSGADKQAGAAGALQSIVQLSAAPEVMHRAREVAYIGGLCRRWHLSVLMLCSALLLCRVAEATPQVR
jgi:hypothetical protein